MCAPASRPSSPAAIAAIVIALIGLAASAASLADSLAPAPAFCAETGCATVRASGWARPLGVPLPVLGLGFFALAAALVVTGDRARSAPARRALATLGGVGALGLIAVQALVIGAWCRLCLIADGAALAYAALVWLGGTAAWPRVRPPGLALVATGLVAAIAVPMVFGRGATPTMVAPSGAALPEVVAREQRAGEVVIVDFVDFECPHCRDLHGRLVQALARADVPVRVVRKMVPLPMHAYALTAALAWCCADAQGKGDAMAEALLAAPIEALSAPGCERLAGEVGLDMARYRADVASASMRARVDADVAAARAAGLRSLPTVYINDQAFVGAGASVDELVAALRRARG